MRIIGYAEDFPASEATVSHGLSRVNGRLFGCLRPQLETLITNRAGYWWREEDLADGLRDTRRPPRWLGRVTTFLANARLNRRRRFPEAVLLAAWIRSRNFAPGSTWLFCPCGSRPEPAIRAAMLARMLRLPLALYLVDDFEAAHELEHGRAMSHALLESFACAIKQAEAVFTITHGLKERFARWSSVEPTVLALPYPQPGNPRPGKTRNQILFVGNASHFYLHGLCDLAEVLRRLPGDTPPRLRITLGKRDRLPEPLRDANLVTLGPSGGSDDLAREISESPICFLPYSFDNKFRTMVTTSFPSKLLDYLAYAKNILCFAPGDSTSVGYFETNGLQTIVKERDPVMLLDAVTNLLATPGDHSRAYRKALEQHAPRLIRDHILGKMAAASHR